MSHTNYALLYFAFLFKIISQEITAYNFMEIILILFLHSVPLCVHCLCLEV